MKLGLKLWSINTDFYYEEAKKLYKEGLFDYIELYVIPNSLETVKKWKKLNIPIALHAPHHVHGINLAVESCFSYNRETFDEVEVFSSELEALYTVVHLGNSGHVDESIRQLERINPGKLLIENKPYVSPLDSNKLCQGATVEEIRYALAALKCGFCLDVGHAICTANYLGLLPYKYVEEFIEFKPLVCHLSDNDVKSHVDAHYNIGKGTYDFSKIAIITKATPYILLETKKNGKENLNDFMEDTYQIKKKYLGI